MSAPTSRGATPNLAPSVETTHPERGAFCMEQLARGRKSGRGDISRWSCSTVGEVSTSAYFYASSGRPTRTKNSFVIFGLLTASRSAPSGYAPCSRACRTTRRWARCLPTRATRVDSVQQRSSAATLQLRYPSKLATGYDLPKSFHVLTL